MAFDYTFPLGGTVVIDIAVQVAGVAYDITGCSFFFTAKVKRTDTDAQAIIVKKTSTSGFTITSASAGLLTLRFNTEGVTPAIPEGVHMYADVKMQTPAGEAYFVESGTICFIKPITLSTS